MTTLAGTKGGAQVKGIMMGTLVTRPGHRLVLLQAMLMLIDTGTYRQGKNQ
jgi:hypothetical protein